MNTSKLLIVSSIAGVALLGAGCQNPITAARDRAMEKVGTTIGEKIIETSSGGKVKLDADGKTLIGTGDDGSRVMIGEGATFPSNMASDFPRFSGAVNTAVSIDATGKSGGFTQHASASPDAVKAALVSQLTSNGYTKASETTLNGGYVLTYKKGNATIGVIIGADANSDSGKTEIVVTRSEQQ